LPGSLNGPSLTARQCTRRHGGQRATGLRGNLSGAGLANRSQHNAPQLNTANVGWMPLDAGRLRNLPRTGAPGEFTLKCL